GWPGAVGDHDAVVTRRFLAGRRRALLVEFAYPTPTIAARCLALTRPPGYIAAAGLALTAFVGATCAPGARLLAPSQPNTARRRPANHTKLPNKPPMLTLPRSASCKPCAQMGRKPPHAICCRSAGDAAGRPPLRDSWRGAGGLCSAVRATRRCRDG